MYIYHWQKTIDGPKCHILRQKRFWMMTDWLAFVHDSVSAPDYHCLTISWQKQRFDNIKTVKDSNVLAFYGILRTFTAIKWDSYPTQYFETLLNKSPGSKYTFSGNFLSCCSSTTARKPLKMCKNAILTAVYGTKNMLNDDRLPCICGWICLSAKTALFDHGLTKVTVLHPKNWQKCHFYGILRHFTALRVSIWTECAL